MRPADNTILTFIKMLIIVGTTQWNVNTGWFSGMILADKKICPLAHMYESFYVQFLVIESVLLC